MQGEPGFPKFYYLATSHMENKIFVTSLFTISLSVYKFGQGTSIRNEQDLS